MRMQVILDSSFRPPGFSSYTGKKGKFRDWTTQGLDPPLGVILVTLGSNNPLRGSGIHNYHNTRSELEEGEGRLIEGDA